MSKMRLGVNFWTNYLSKSTFLRRNVVGPVRKIYFVFDKNRLPNLPTVTDSSKKESRALEMSGKRVTAARNSVMGNCSFVV